MTAYVPTKWEVWLIFVANLVAVMFVSSGLVVFDDWFVRGILCVWLVIISCYLPEAFFMAVHYED